MGFEIHVLLAYAILYAEAHDKQINFKIGFDLTEGENGGPSLRVRDFKDSKEGNQRAEDKSDEKTKPAARADSESVDTSDDSTAKKRDNSDESAGKPAVASDQSRDDDDDGENSNESRAVELSTKGPGDYEPKREDARIHERDVDSSEDRRRKREAGTFGHLKRKSKKFFAAEKQEASW